MRPEGLEQHYYFGGGATETNVAPLVACILILACVLIFVLKRKYILVPFFLAGFLIPITQVIVVFGFHLQTYRVLILAGWLRIFWSAFLTKQDPFPGPINALDKIFAGWALCNAVMYTILWRDPGALANRFGFLYATFGTYFLLRYVLRDREDVVRAIKLLAIVMIPIAIMMSMEHFTARNPISFLTGVAQFPDVRAGRIRAQGPFAHSIIAGTFGAALFPLFVGLWQQGRGNRITAAMGMISSVVAVIMSSSSTPVMTLSAAVVGFCFWSMRKSMRAVRWGIVVSIILLQLFMKAPIWFLMARLGPLLGGTGWHRAELIDQFVHHFGEWWLIGTQNNASWGLDMWDSINVYVNAGVEGGFITFVLFFCLIVYAFKRIGTARANADGNLPAERLTWAIGAALFANTIAFLGIAYFDQSVIAWYALLAMISMAPSVAVADIPQENFEFAHLRGPATALVNRRWVRPEPAHFPVTRFR